MHHSELDSKALYVPNFIFSKCMERKKNNITDAHTLKPLEMALDTVRYIKKYIDKVSLTIHCVSFVNVQKKLDLRIGEPMQICIHHKDNSPNPVNHCLIWRGQRLNLTTSENSQPMISCRLVSHCKPLGPIISNL